MRAVLIKPETDMCTYSFEETYPIEVESIEIAFDDIRDEIHRCALTLKDDNPKLFFNYMGVTLGIHDILDEETIMAITESPLNAICIDDDLMWFKLLSIDEWFDRYSTKEKINDGY